MKKLLRLLLIREDEKTPVLYFLSLFFIIGCGMAMGKASADALFFKRFGIEYLPLMYVALGILLTAVSFVYAAFADKISAEKFFSRLFFILIIVLISIWSLISYTDNNASYPVYFLVYEAASEILLIHTTLYLNQNMDTYKSKRLSPIVLAGSQLGLITGGILVAILSPLIGTSQIILLWCGMLIMAAIMMIIWHKIKGPSAYFYSKRGSHSLQQSLLAIKQGINFSRRSSLLRASSLAFFFLVITFYTLYYVTNQFYTSHFTSEEDLTAFFGILTAITSLSALLLQVFVTNRSIEKFGIRKVNLFFPLATTFGFINLLIFLKFPSAILGSFIKDSIAPAFSKPVTNMMFNILPKNIQGRARAVSMGIILPLALFSCALLLTVAQRYENSFYFLIPGLITSLCLLYFSTRMNKAYIKTLIQHLKEQVYLPEKTLSEHSTDALLKSLTQNIDQSDDKLTISCAKILIKTHPKKATAIIAKRLLSSNSKTADQLIKIVSEYSLKPLRHILENPDRYPQFDQHIEASILNILFKNKARFSEKYISPALNSSNPRLISAAIFGAYRLNSSKNIPKATSLWTELSCSGNTRLLTILSLINCITKTRDGTVNTLIKNYQTAFLKLLNSNNLNWQLQTLYTLSHWHYPITAEISKLLIQLFDNSNPYLRSAVVICSDLLDLPEKMSLLTFALEDGHANVRNEAMQILLNNSPDAEHIAHQWLTNNSSFTTPRAQLTVLEQLLEEGLTRKTLHEIAEKKTLLARQFYDAMQQLKSVKDKNSTYHLVYSTVSERLQQTANLLLSILEQLEENEIVSVVKAAINSADEQLISTACEAIKCLDNKVISNLLIDVLQDDFELKSNYILCFSTIDETLNWCKLQDQWLNTCANRALTND